MKPRCSYNVGQMYSLEQIKGIASNLKSVGAQASKYGLLHIYNERGTNLFWLAGPLAGEHTNLFLFLGEQAKKNKSVAQFREVLSIAAQAILCQGYDLFLEHDWDLRYLNAGASKRTG